MQAERLEEQVEEVKQGKHDVQQLLEATQVELEASRRECTALETGVEELKGEVLREQQRRSASEIEIP